MLAGSADPRCSHPAPAGARGLPTFIPPVVELVELLRELRQRLLDGLRPRNRERKPPLEVFHLVHFPLCCEGWQSPAGKGREEVERDGQCTGRPPRSCSLGLAAPRPEFPLLGICGGPWGHPLLRGTTAASEQSGSHTVTRFLMNLRADCGQEVQGAFSGLVIRAMDNESQVPTQAAPYSILGNSRNAWKREKQGRNRRKAGKRKQ